MRRKIVQFLGLLLSSIIIINTSVYASENHCNTMKNRTMAAGEVINFKIYYNLSAVWVAAGEAKFEAKFTLLNNHPVYHLIGTGHTFSSYDWIFKVRDRYESYVDTATMLPKRFIRDISEGNYKKHQEVNFNRNTNQAVSLVKSIPVSDCVLDVVSAIYYARNIDYDKYKPGDKIEIALHLDDEVNDIYIRYMGKETITTKYGKFKAIKIKPLLIDGTVFEGGEKMEVWVTDDKNRMPIRVNSPILVGSIKAEMMGYKNLRYPLTSLISKK